MHYVLCNWIFLLVVRVCWYTEHFFAIKHEIESAFLMWYYLRYPIRCFDCLLSRIKGGCLSVMLVLHSTLFIEFVPFSHAQRIFRIISSFSEILLMTTWHYAKLVPTFLFFCCSSSTSPIQCTTYLYSLFAWFGKANKHTLANANSTCISSIFCFINKLGSLPFFTRRKTHKRCSLIWSWLVSMLFFFSIRKFA